MKTDNPKNQAVDSEQSTSLAPAPQVPTESVQKTEEELVLCTYAGCGRTYSSLKSLNGHNRQAHLPPEDELNLPFRCAAEGCNRTFSTPGGLGVHRNTNHGPPKEMVHKCTFKGCLKVFALRNAWRKHQKVHDPASMAKLACTAAIQPVEQPRIRTPDNFRPYKCSVQGCNKAYTRKDGLKNHQKSHSELTAFLALSTEINKPRPYICSFQGCIKAYTHKDSLRHHMKDHTTAPLRPTVAPFVGSSIAPSIAPTNTLSAPPSLTTPSTAPGHYPHRYSEDNCDKIFRRPSGLKNHQGPSHGRWRCTKLGCDFESRSKEAWLGHKAQAHNSNTTGSVVSNATHEVAVHSIHAGGSTTHSVTVSLGNENDESPLRRELNPQTSNIISSASKQPISIPGSSQPLPVDAAMHDLVPDEFESTPIQLGSQQPQDIQHQENFEPLEWDMTRNQIRAKFISSLLGTMKEEFEEEMQYMAFVATNSLHLHITSLADSQQASTIPHAAGSNLKDLTNNACPESQTAPSTNTTNEGAATPHPDSPLASPIPARQSPVLNSPTKATLTSPVPSDSPSLSLPPSPARGFAPPLKRLGAAAYDKMALANFQSEQSECRPARRSARRHLRSESMEDPTSFNDYRFSSYPKNAPSSHYNNRQPKMTPQFATAIASHAATAFIAHQSGNVKRLTIDPFYNPDDSDPQQTLAMSASISFPSSLQLQTQRANITPKSVPLTYRPHTSQAPTQARMFFTTEAQVGPSTYIEQYQIFLDGKYYQTKHVTQGKQQREERKGERGQKRKRKTCIGPPRQKRKYNWKGGVCKRPTSLEKLERAVGMELVLEGKSMSDRVEMADESKVGDYIVGTSLEGSGVGTSQRDDLGCDDEDSEEDADDNGMTERRGDSQGVDEDDFGF